MSIGFVSLSLSNIPNIATSVSKRKIFDILKTSLSFDGLNTQRGPQHMALEIHVVACNIHKIVAGLNQLMPSPLYNWISNGNTYKTNDKRKALNRFFNIEGLSIGHRCGRDFMVIRFTTTCAVNANHH